MVTSSTSPKTSNLITHTIEVIVDRLVAKPNMKRRLAASVETALRLADGVLLVATENERHPYSQALSCPTCGISFEELQPRNFSFNSPYGACSACSGIGTRFQVDPDLVIPNPERSIADGTIAPWNGHRGKYFQRLLEGLAVEHKFDVTAPFGTLSEKAKDVILSGSGDERVKISYANRFGRQREYYTTYEGVLPFVRRKHEEAESDGARIFYQDFMREVPCLTCNGTRYNPVSRAVTVGGRGIAEVSAESLGDAYQFVRDLELDDRQVVIAERVLKEVRERLSFLIDVGLDYLTLGRSAATLAGGEAQRIRLATQIGSGLVGVLYILDEPSIGLHQRDNQRLIETLLRLRDLGNTLIVVEHDEETIRIADHIVDIGPGAGEHGGEIVVQGTLKQVLASKDSITGEYLSGKRTIAIPGVRRPGNGLAVEVLGAAENNLQGVDVAFPLGVFTAITGVSGSGKSSLVQTILSRGLHQAVYGSRIAPGRHKQITGVEHIDKVINIDQSPIGRTPRSNPATYTKLFDQIRTLFSATNEAKARGYKPGRFSFNVPGGRCETCKGDGTIKIEMHFLPDVYVPCETCKGRRYNRETLEITWKSRSIADVLEMPVEEALSFFTHQPKIARILQTLFDVGLGYVRLGQPAPTLSGGEAQRVKLASELGKRSTGRTFYILDEPTTGLHFEDIRKLLGVLQRLVDAGNTVVVIEHNLDVIKSVDWVVDLGPNGGTGGGTIVAQGTPEEVAEVEESFTGQYLRHLLP